MWETVTKDCKELILKMVTTPDKRLTPQQVLDHPWIQEMTEKTALVTLPALVTTNLKNFSVTQKVKKVVLAYLATQLSEKEVDTLRRLFIGLDKNGDGVLSTDEVRDGLKGRSNEHELTAIVESIDTDHSGFVDYNGTINSGITMHRIPSSLSWRRHIYEPRKINASIQHV